MDWYKSFSLPSSTTSLYLIVVSEDTMDVKYKIK